MFNRNRSLVFLGVMVGGCAFEPGTSPSGDPARIAAFELELSAQRVVLTPGGHDEVRIALGRGDDGDHPVLLQLEGDPGELEVALSDHVTREDVATLSVNAPASAEAQEVTLGLRARLGPNEQLEEITLSVQLPGTAEAGAEQFAPGVVGAPHTALLDGALVSYQVIDGIAVADGDILLGDAAAVAARSGERTVTCNYGFHTDFTCSPWTDGVIGYSFADDWGDDDENNRMHAIIEQAIDAWEADTGMRFVRRSSGEYLRFRKGDGCSSNLGRAIITGFDSQSIYLDNHGCDHTGIVMHEIGHAVGLYHEQSRNDRDSYIVVDFGRVQDGQLDQFFQWGEASRDHGPYDYDSIMHYSRWAFARDEAACQAGDLDQCTIRPNDPTANIGQRDHLSENDILGAYTLYPPKYEITGATPGETGDRFFLSLDFSTPVPRPVRIEWTSSLSPTPLGTGTYLDLRAIDVPAGPQVITASFIVADTIVTSRSIALNVTNHPPSVTLVTTNGRLDQEIGEVFSVTALVSDVEDANCPPGTCHYTWSREPATGPADTQTASFQFHWTGSFEIGVTVEDRGGATMTTSIMVHIINSPPIATITSPASPSVVVPEGMPLALQGYASDPGQTQNVWCSYMRWSSSNAGDVFSNPQSCDPTVTFAGHGTRTITLFAVDRAGQESAPVSVEVTVTACSGDCAPTALLGVSGPDWVVSGFSTHGLDRTMQLRIDLGDVEAPADNPVHYRLTAQRGGEPTVVIVEGDAVITDPATTMRVDQSWLPSDDMSAWTSCEFPDHYREWDLVLEARDASGQVTTTHEPVTLGCTLH